jgi:hypothetical protein
MQQTRPHGIHQATYDAVFQHPVARNLQWRDVRSMLAALSDATEEREETVKYTRNGRTLSVHPPKRKDFSDVAELMRIRQFLERSAAAPAAVAGAAAAADLVVVIDHREARVFRATAHGSLPERVVAHEPGGPHRHLHNVGDESDGQRRPEPRAFYDAVAEALGDAGRVLLLGSATGSSSAMDRLVAELKARHPAVAARVAGAVVVNAQHLTDDQLLAKARDFYAGASEATH